MGIPLVTVGLLVVLSIVAGLAAYCFIVWAGKE